MNYQQWAQYGRNIFWDVFHTLEAKIPQNIPKCTIPVLCGLPILYYATKKWRSRVTVEDNYQRIINEKNNTTQSVIDCIAFYDSDSIKKIDYEIMFDKLIRFNENYNKFSRNKINDINLFKTKKDFLDCKQYHYKLFIIYYLLYIIYYLLSIIYYLFILKVWKVLKARDRYSYP